MRPEVKWFKSMKDSEADSVSETQTSMSSSLAQLVT